MMKRFLLALAFVGVAVTATAQTSLNETTVSTAMTASQTNIVLASATGVADNYVIYVDNEAMIVQASWSSGTTVPVIRGALGTVARAHDDGVLVYIGPQVAFIGGSMSGSCVPADQRYTPNINPVSGAIYSCPSAVEKWVNLRDRIPVVCQTGALYTSSIDQSCFTADRQYLVVAISYVATVAEAGGTLTLIPRRQQSTEAPASGDSLVASALNVVTTGTAAQTVANLTLTTTEAYLILEAGNRLGLDFTDDVAGELAGVVVTFWLVPL